MNYFRIVLIFILWHLICPSAPGFDLCTQVSATELLFTSSVGYNSNPALAADTEAGDGITGSPFSSHTLALEQMFDLDEKFTVDVSPSVSYQNLWKTADNHQFNVDLSISPASAWQRVLPYIFTNGYVYRDSLIKTDERDEFTLGVGAEILLSGRYTLCFEHAWQRISYLESASLFSRVGRELNTAENSINPLLPEVVFNDPLYKTFDAPDDVNMLLKANLDMFILPSLTLSAGLKYEYLASSLEAESFWQVTPDIEIVWEFANQWQFVVATQLESRKYFNIYDAFPGSLDAESNSTYDMSETVDPYINSDIFSVRTLNYTTSLNFRLAYFWKRVELFSSFFIEHGEYPLNNESYNQQVVECGFSWSF